jgi:hypothetical protein
VAVPRRPKVEQACAAVREDLDALSQRTTQRIRSAVPAYVRVPVEEHVSAVRTQHENVLTMLEQSRGATPEELFVARRIGRQRARQGLTLEDVVEAFHIGCEQTWEALSAAAPSDRDLLQAVSRLWRWIHEAANAVAEGHQDVTTRESAADAATRNEFFAALRERRAESAVALAPALGYDVADGFQAVVVLGTTADDERLRGATTMLGRLSSGTSHCTRRGRTVAVLLQGMPAEEVEPVLRRYALCGPTGVGLSRVGIEGAMDTLVDATQAAALAEPGGPWLRFEDEWLNAVLAESADRLRAVVQREMAVAEEHPALAQTVAALLDNDMSVSRAAAALFLHPNTTRYRLDRWQELTGQDPRAAPGMLRAVAAAVLRRREVLGADG